MPDSSAADSDSALIVLRLSAKPDSRKLAARRRPGIGSLDRAPLPLRTTAGPGVGEAGRVRLGGRADQTARVRSNSRSLAMRSSVGGWVENSLAKLTWRPVSGLMMYAVASAGFTSIGT